MTCRRLTGKKKKMKPAENGGKDRMAEWLLMQNDY
jgi:hypothetical protein